MVNIRDILLSSKFTHSQRIYLIACLTIPFFLNRSIDDQTILCSISMKGIHRVKNELIDLGIIKIYDIRDIDIDYIILKKKL